MLIYSKKWKHREVEYLQTYCEQCGISELAEILRRNESDVLAMLQILDFTCKSSSTLAKERPPRFHKLHGRQSFTEEEDQYLIKNYAEKSITELVADLGRKRCHVKGALQRLGLRKRATRLVKEWTLQEEQYLIDNYKLLEISSLACFLGRSTSAVRSKLIKMDIHSMGVITKDRSSSAQPWTEDEEQYILDNWLKQSHRDLAYNLNRTQASIGGKCRNLGLVRTYETNAQLRQSPSALTDRDVASRIAGPLTNKKDRYEYLKYQKLIELKRATILLNRKLNQL